MSELLKTKQPKSIEVKLLVPYAIITIMLVGIAGTVMGWQARGHQQDQIEARASTMLTKLSKPVEQK